MNPIQAKQRQIDDKVKSLSSHRFILSLGHKLDDYDELEKDILGLIEELELLKACPPLFMFVLTTSAKKIKSAWNTDLVNLVQDLYGEAPEDWIPYRMDGVSGNHSIGNIRNELLNSYKGLSVTFITELDETTTQNLIDYRDTSIFIIDVFSSICFDEQLCIHITPRQEFHLWNIKFSYCKTTIKVNNDNEILKDSLTANLKNKFSYYEKLHRRLLTKDFVLSYNAIAFSSPRSQLEELKDWIRDRVSHILRSLRQSVQDTQRQSDFNFAQNNISS